MNYEKMQPDELLDTPATTGACKEVLRRLEAMEQTHTLGKWRIVPWFDEKAVIVVGEPGVDFVIAKVEDKVDSADARLIAAAPDLLAACQAADKLIENLWDAVDWGKTFNLDIRALNEAPLSLKRAIAKATCKAAPDSAS